MKKNKLYFLLALYTSSAYVIQRALLFMSGGISMDDVINEKQAESGFLGIDVSFSYLGMNIFWPLVISFFVLGYRHYREGDKDSPLLLLTLKQKKMLSVSVTLVPLVAISLHFLSIIEHIAYNLDIAIASFDQVSNMQRGNDKPPSFNARFSAITQIILIVLSISLFLVTISRKPANS